MTGAGAPEDVPGRPRRSHAPGLWDPKLLALLLALVAGVLVSHFIHPLPSEIRWGFLVLLLMGIAGTVFGAVYRRTVRVPALDPPETDDPRTSGELARLIRILKRASRGLPYSQGMVALRAREAFLALVRFELGLEPEELEALLEDPSEVRRLVRDPALRKFLVDTDPGEERPHDPGVLQRGLPGPDGTAAGFLTRMERVLAAMGEWP